MKFLHYFLTIKVLYSLYSTVKSQDCPDGEVYNTNLKKCEPCEFYEFYDEETKKCQSCEMKNEEKKYFRFEDNVKSCVKRCDQFERLISEINVCYYCKNQTLFYDRGVCVDKCRDSTIASTTEGLCRDCKWSGKFLYNNTCIDSCPSTTVMEEYPVCINCKEKEGDSKYLYDGKCVEKCPDNSILFDYFSNLCVKCEYLGMYQSEGHCNRYCNGPNEGLGDTGLCVKCEKIVYEDGWVDQFFFRGGQCAGGCGKNAYLVADQQKGDYCVSCKDTGQFTMIIDPSGKSKGTCTWDCGTLATDWKANVCFSEENKWTPTLPIDEEDAKVFFINAMSVYNICNPGKWGYYCRRNDEDRDENKNLLDDYKKFLMNVKNQDFYFKDNEEYYGENFDEFARALYQVSNFNNFQSETPGEPSMLEVLEEFATTYYNSGETYRFDDKDIPYFHYIYQFIFMYKYNQMYNYHLELEETKFLIDKGVMLKDLIDSFQSTYETYILKLNQMTSYIIESQIKDPELNFPLAGLYFSSSNTYANFEFTDFLATVYNFNKYKLSKVWDHKPFVTVSRICEKIVENYYALTHDFLPDLSVFYDNTAWRSRYYYFGMYNSSYTGVSVDCDHQIYFPVVDNFRFNFSYPRKVYNNLQKIGIDPFNPEDPYFTNVCYKFPNQTTSQMSRNKRIENYFLGATVKCNLKDVNEDTAQSCTFKGFWDSFVYYGPNPYLVCECPTIRKESYNYISIKYHEITSLPSPVFQIWMCNVPDATELFLNPAFLILSVLLIFEITLIILHFIFLEYRFFKNFKYIRKHDMDFLEYLMPKASEENKELLGEQNNNDELTKSEFRRRTLTVNKRRGVFASDKRKVSSTTGAYIKNLDSYSKNLNISDYSKLSFITCVDFDEKRSLKDYFYDYVYDYHIISVHLIKFSYFIPGLIRILNFFAYLVNHFFIVGIFFSVEEYDMFGGDKDSFAGIFLYVIVACLYSKLVNALISLLITTPHEMRIYLNKILFHKYLAIKEFQINLYDSYSFKLIFFLVINISIQILCGIYVINLMGLYLPDRYYYCIKLFLVLILDFGLVSFIVPLAALLCRMMVFKYRKTSWFPAYKLLEQWKNWQRYI